MKRAGVIKSECNHKFHLACLSKWAEQNETCPVCRKQLDPTTLQKLYPDTVDYVCKMIFSLDATKRQQLVDAIAESSYTLGNNAYHQAMMPPLPQDIYSYIAFSPSDDDVDPDYHPMGA
jgi:hypothetical protein